MRWRRKPNPRQIRSWVDTGDPAWVERWVEHPDVAAELERLTALHAAESRALSAVLEPSTGFVERTTRGVTDRVSDLERVGALFGLLGLGPRTARALLDPPSRPAQDS